MNKTTKITLIAIAVIIGALVFGFRVFAKAEPKQEIILDPCRTSADTMTKEEFTNCAKEQFSRKFDKIQAEKENNHKKVDEEAEMKMWRAIENIATYTGSNGTGLK